MAKRADGEGTIRKRANGTWEARYTVGFDADGKQIRKSVYGKTKKEVAAKLGQIVTDIKNGEYIPANSMTVDNWKEEWLSKHLLKARESTKYQYEQYFRLYIIPSIGTMKIQSVSPRVVQDIIATVSKKLSAKTVRNLHGILHHFFEDAVRMEIISKNPAEYTELPKLEKKEMLILDGELVSLFLKEIKGKPFEELFFVDLFTGLREGEILGLTWDCIDFKKRTIKIHQQLKRDSHIGEKNSQYIIADTKTGNQRLISPPPSVFETLKKVKAKQSANKLLYGSSYQNLNNLVFTDELGRWINGRTLLKAFKKRVANIGIPEMRFHDLRHTYTSLALQNGDDLKYVSSSLGHTTIATTANIYSHLTEKMRADSAARMESFINDVQAQ